MIEIVTVFFGASLLIMGAAALGFIFLVPAFPLIYAIANFVKKTKPHLYPTALILSTAILTPFLSFLYYIICYKISLTFSNISLILILTVLPYLISLSWIFIILPAYFAVLLVKRFKTKSKKTKQFILCAIMFFLFILFGFLGFYVTDKMETKRIDNILAAYNPAIIEIENYKLHNKVYPKDPECLKEIKKGFKYYKYTALNNGADFILEVSNSEYMFNSYNYCSSKKYEQCFAHTKYPMEYIQRGKWIEEINND